MLVRYCRVDPECLHKNTAWKKRLVLMNHLRKGHEVYVDVPRSNVGRPKSCEKFPLPSIAQSHKQSMTRFANIRCGCTMQERNISNSAKISAKEGSYNGKIPYEAWEKKFIKNGMKEWEAGMFHRVAAMETHINKRYDAMSRKHRKRQHWDKRRSMMRVMVLRVNFHCFKSCPIVMELRTIYARDIMASKFNLTPIF
ncbi:hypothetical protein L7F22_068862 [Adiantum nelumboides]|nr:hypothetical protein [Adiantum nelumboides]